MALFTVRCPRCKHDMKFLPLKEGLVTAKSKKCVYCGMSFKIHSNAERSRIVKIS